ncbi:hypothetical protein THAOC_21672, partial [Thalassiosira oceanica]
HAGEDPDNNSGSIGCEEGSPRRLGGSSAKPVEPSSCATLPSTPVKAPTIGSSNRASPSSKRATGETGNFEGGYQPGETEGNVYWAASATNDLRAPRCDRGSRGFPSPKKGAHGPPQRDKRHWANPSYRVAPPHQQR